MESCRYFLQAFIFPWKTERSCDKPSLRGRAFKKLRCQVSIGVSALKFNPQWREAENAATQRSLLLRWQQDRYPECGMFVRLKAIRIDFRWKETPGEEIDWHWMSVARDDTLLGIGVVGYEFPWAPNDQSQSDLKELFINFLRKENFSCHLLPIHRR